LYSWLKMHFCTLKRRNTGIGQKILKTANKLVGNVSIEWNGPSGNASSFCERLPRFRRCRSSCAWLKVGAGNDCWKRISPQNFDEPTLIGDGWYKNLLT
jgi:hypothetical protein